MTAAKPAVVGYLLPGLPRTGFWCARCSLPSRVEVTVYLLPARSWHISVAGVWTTCTECGDNA